MPITISLNFNVTVEYFKFTCTFYKIMLLHFAFHSEISKFEGLKCKARGLKVSDSKARGSKAQHTEYSFNVRRCVSPIKSHDARN